MIEVFYKKFDLTSSSIYTKKLDKVIDQDLVDTFPDINEKC